MNDVGYRTPNENYFYMAGLHIIKEKGMQANRGFVFVVCTDEIPWAEDFLNPRKLVAFAKSRNWVEKDLQWIGANVHFHVVHNVTARDKALCILTLMDHMIMSVGTFGWWAAFLNENTYKYSCSINGNNTEICVPTRKPILVYFNDPFRPGSAVAGYFSVPDHYPPHWIGFGNT